MVIDGRVDLYISRVGHADGGINFCVLEININVLCHIVSWSVPKGVEVFIAQGIRSYLCPWQPDAILTVTSQSVSICSHSRTNPSAMTSLTTGEECAEVGSYGLHDLDRKELRVDGALSYIFIKIVPLGYAARNTGEFDFVACCRDGVVLIAVACQVPPGEC